jgi:hypothetical protein
MTSCVLVALTMVSRGVRGRLRGLRGPAKPMVDSVDHNTGSVTELELSSNAPRVWGADRKTIRSVSVAGSTAAEK